MSTRVWLCSVVLAALAGFGSSTQAEEPLGSEFQVNTYTTGSQSLPAVAKDVDGSFMVVWESSGQDGSGDGIFGQRYDADGEPIGSEFQVNSYTNGSQSDPRVASGEEGNFVVIWKSAGGILGQRYDAAGAGVGEEFLVTANGAYFGFDIAADADGDFIVVWDRLTGGFFDSFGRRFDASGNPLGSEFQVPDSGHELTPTVASAANGDFVIAWAANPPFLGDIDAQRYDSSGQPLGSVFTVNSYINGYDPDVAADAAGNFVVVWRDHGYFCVYGCYSTDGLYGVRYDAAGNAGTKFKFGNTEFNPAVSSDAVGNFIVVWQGAAIYGREYDPEAIPRGERFQINTHTTSAHGVPAVDASSGGDFVVAWTSQGQVGDSGDVFGQRYAGPGPSLSVDRGTCPGEATVSISNAPPDSEVAIVSAANTNGFVKGGILCPGTQFEIGEPFALPPTFVIVDGEGRGSVELELQPGRCFLEALAFADCSTSRAVEVPPTELP